LLRRPSVERKPGGESFGAQAEMLPIIIRIAANTSPDLSMCQAMF
jgi:hypothetical protein